MPPPTPHSSIDITVDVAAEPASLLSDWSATSVLVDDVNTHPPHLRSRNHGIEV